MQQLGSEHLASTVREFSRSAARARPQPAFRAFEMPAALPRVHETSCQSNLTAANGAVSRQENFGLMGLGHSMSNQLGGGARRTLGVPWVADPEMQTKTLLWQAKFQPGHLSHQRIARSP